MSDKQTKNQINFFLGVSHKLLTMGLIYLYILPLVFCANQILKNFGLYLYLKKDVTSLFFVGALFLFDRFRNVLNLPFSLFSIAVCFASIFFGEQMVAISSLAFYMSALVAGEVFFV